MKQGFRLRRGAGMLWCRKMAGNLGAMLMCFSGVLISNGLGDDAEKKDHMAGQDVVEAFARAHQGSPLRYVIIGGSITEASGDGWIGEWLKTKFPKANVFVRNSGVSGLGSSLGVFRVEPDVIAYQPDLVAIEFCVNDGDFND